MTDCPVCDGSGWVRAAPVSPFSWTHKVGRVAMWAHAVVVPCFACGGKTGSPWGGNTN
jgi:hypothetical protein